MAEKTMVIIGAGLAGLSTGCYGRMNGYKTHIYEHHTMPGGVCTAWKRDGYVMDGCIHWLMSCKPGSGFRKIYDELGAFRDNRLMFLDHYVRFHDQDSDQALDFGSDLDRLAADMKAIAPEDSLSIDEFIKGCRDLAALDMPAPEPRELGMGAGVKSLWEMRGFLKYMIKYNVPVNQYTLRFKNLFIRECINKLFLPDMPVSFLFVVLGQLAGGQLGCVEGGSQRFSDAIARRYQELGGEITYRASVEEILVENDRAVGIRLADGSGIKADIVVSAADGYSTIFQMLGGKYLDQSIRHRFETWPLFKPLLMITYGAAREYSGEKAAQLIKLPKPLKILNQETDSMHLRIFNYDASLAPSGCTVLQATLETGYDGWMDLQKDSAAYDREKERIAGEVLQIIDGLFPGTKDSIEVTDVATPYTWFYYTRNYRGSYEGWLMTKEALQTQIPKALPGLQNFYMAGQWVEPGGGIPPALYSGRNLIRILCKQDHKIFTVAGS